MWVDISRIRVEIDRIRVDVDRIRIDIDRIRVDIDRIWGEIDQKFDRIRGENDRILGEMNRCRGEIDRVQGEINRIQRSLNGFGGRLTGSGGNLTGSEREIDRIRVSLSLEKLLISLSRSLSLYTSCVVYLSARSSIACPRCSDPFNITYNINGHTVCKGLDPVQSFRHSSGINIYIFIYKYTFFPLFTHAVTMLFFSQRKIRNLKI